MTNSYPSGSPGVPDSSMPTEAPRFMAPRRFSYASVVSGTASGISQPYQQPARSGTFSHLLNPNSDFSYESNHQNFSGGTRYDMRGLNLDYDTNGSTHGRSASWGRGVQLPSFSSAFGSVMGGQAYGHLGGTSFVDSFFIPSYLRHSKYVQKLEEAHKVKIAALKDAQSAPASQSGSLSTSASSVNLHAKLAPSHRGMTFDLIENRAPLDDETLPPLPSRLNNQDKQVGLEVLSDGQEVKFSGPKPDRERDHEACAIRADHPMPSQCGIYYFEVTILTRKREESSIGIGFSGPKVALARLPGWEPDSWAYHGDDGHSFCCQTSGKHYGPPFTTGDTIGCGVNFKTGSAFFTRNGDHLGIAFREIKGKLYPSVGMKRAGEHVRMNFGQSPFVFDIDGMMARERDNIRIEIEATSTARLAPPTDETELIQSLVLQFLTHDGYVETARAFAEEIHTEKKALSLNADADIPGYDLTEDEDAGHRQKIRAAILDGDIERALKYTYAYYPQVLKDNEHVYFRLRCRRFVEMIRQGAELNNSNTNSTNGSRKHNGHNGDWYDDIINHDMDIDDHQPQTNHWDKMETEDSSGNQAEYHILLQETLAYGQDLQSEFKDDPRREVSKALEDAFALMAYEDPLNAKEVAYLLDPSGRVVVAEELNSAILNSLGKSSSAALEKLYQQATVLLEDIREGGGPGAFVNIDDFARPRN